MPEKMKALIVDMRNGKPEMVPGEHGKPVSGDFDLLVKTEATALNRADLLQKAGKYDPPEGESPILGLEMAGIVESTGSSVTKYKPGDRVFGLLGGGGYAEYCTIHENLAMPIPEEYSYEEAAAVPEVFLTAWQALMWLGRLKKGETVLIHAGASGVGTAAIQLASQFTGARIAVTAGSDEKLQLCRELGVELAVNYKERNFAEEIEKAFGRDSVNLVIDFVGSPYWKMNMDCIAMDGRMVCLAMLGGAKLENASLVPVLRKRLTVMGSTLRNRTDEYKAELTSDFFKNAQDLLKSFKIRPIIDSVYDWTRAEDAHSRMEKNMNAGKIILSFGGR
jgi:tumor protein p53-inducible protein 3